jgi:lysophospholipase
VLRHVWGLLENVDIRGLWLHDDLNQFQRLGFQAPSAAGLLSGKCDIRIGVIHIAPKAWGCPPPFKRNGWPADLLTGRITYGAYWKIIMESISENLPDENGADQYLRSFDGLRLRYRQWRADNTNNRGIVVVLGGRTEFIEKYLETIGEINARGFDALSFDWRGQGLSDRMLPDCEKGYVKSYEHYVRDLKYVLEKTHLIHNNKPVYIMAHSMGGHIALRYLRQYTNPVAKAILIAPMIQVRTFPAPVQLMRLLSRWMVRNGWPAAIMPTPGRNDSFDRPFAINRLTSDRVRFNRVCQLMTENPHLVVRGITFGWLDATFDSIEKLQQPGYVRSIQTPVMLVTAERDYVVANRATTRLAAELPNHRLVEVALANHEILQERNALRDEFWRQFDRFVG